jgi:hypothetical protein
MKAYIIPIAAFAFTFSLLSCQHQPFLNENGGSDPTDEIIDTDAVDFVINTQACEDNVIYFENEVLPIFISNCAISGCHDAQSAEDGVVLVDYTTIRRKMTPGDPNDSEYYTVLLDTESDELMPRDPKTGKGFSLPAEQINTIKTWIEQGAKNNYCDECDTTSYTYSGTIKLIVDQNCASSSACHGAGTQYGDFTTYSGLVSRVNNQQVQKRAIVDKNMPPAGALPDCELLLIKNWIDAGALNN